MRAKPSRALLKRSCAWIREHWNAQNLDVPEEFRRQWIYAPEEPAEPNGFHLAVFLFGFMQYELGAHRVPLGEKISISSEEVAEYFEAWQLKLALAEVHHTTNLRTAPTPLFSFPKDESVRAWQALPGDH